MKISEIRILRGPNYWSINQDPSTEAILKAAEKRNIPVVRLNTGSFVQLGYGRNQKRIDATITENTGAIAVDIATDKSRTKEMLLAAGLPVPEGTIIRDAEELDAAIPKVGFPLVVKPNDGNQGNGVSLVIRTREPRSFSTRLSSGSMTTPVAEKNRRSLNLFIRE